MPIPRPSSQLQPSWIRVIFEDENKHPEGKRSAAPQLALLALVGRKTPKQLSDRGTPIQPNLSPRGKGQAPNSALFEERRYPENVVDHQNEKRNPERCSKGYL